MASTRLDEVDRHPAKQEIEACLARKVPLRKLAARHGVSITILSRHHKKMREQRPKTYAALEARNWAVTPEELERVRTETREGWIVTLRGQVDKLISAQDEAFDDERWASGAQLAGQALNAMRMLGESTGNLTDGAPHVVQNNVVVLAELQQLKTTILNALRGHPEAMRAVLAALRGQDEEIPHHRSSVPLLEACPA